MGVKSGVFFVFLVIRVDSLDDMSGFFVLQMIRVHFVLYRYEWVFVLEMIRVDFVFYMIRVCLLVWIIRVCFRALDDKSGGLCFR